MSSGGVARTVEAPKVESTLGPPCTRSGLRDERSGVGEVKEAKASESGESGDAVGGDWETPKGRTGPESGLGEVPGSAEGRMLRFELGASSDSPSGLDTHDWRKIEGPLKPEVSTRRTGKVTKSPGGGIVYSDRTYDVDGFRRRAGCVCVSNDLTRVLLMSRRHGGDRFSIPAGGVEIGEDVESAASREVLEEVGLEGKLVGNLGVFERGTKTRTAFYVLHTSKELEVWDEADARQRTWFPLDEAPSKLPKDSMVQAVARSAVDYVKSKLTL